METVGLSCPVTAVLLLDHPRLVVAAFGRRLRVWASRKVTSFGESGAGDGASAADADGVVPGGQSRGDADVDPLGPIGLVVGGFVCGPEPASEVVVFPDTSRIHGICRLDEGSTWQGREVQDVQLNGACT